MKILIPYLVFIVMAFVINHFASAQSLQKDYSNEEEISFFSIGLQTQYAPFTGNNFLSTQYSIRPGYMVETRFGLKDFVGFGAYLGKSRAEIIERDFLGNDFADARFRDSGFFFYYQYFFNQKFGVEPQLGYGFLSVKHVGQSDNFKLNYQNAFIGLNGNFNVSKKRDLVLFGGVRYMRYFTNNIIMDDTNLDFTRKSQRLVFQLGIRCEFFR